MLDREKHYAVQEYNIRRMLTEQQPVCLLLCIAQDRTDLDEVAEAARRAAAMALPGWTVTTRSIMRAVRIVTLALSPIETQGDIQPFDRQLLQLLEQVPGITSVEADSIVNTC